MAHKELCFVWGPPLSGQRCWMARSAGESPDDVKVSLLPLENYTKPAELPEILEALDRVMSEDLPGGKGHHIYCELPWSVTEEGIFLEDWLVEKQVFQGTESEWNLGFICLCPNDADRLPEMYRLGLEEFSRASHSAVIVIKVEGEEGSPHWLGTETLDFGRTLEVFEEVLWPKPEQDPTLALPRKLDASELEFLTLPFLGEPATALALFRALERGDFGNIWGAELYWKNTQGQFEAMTLTQSRVFDWVSNHLSLVDSTFANGALLNIAGQYLKSKEIQANLPQKLFC